MRKRCAKLEGKLIGKEGQENLTSTGRSECKSCRKAAEMFLTNLIEKQ